MRTLGLLEHGVTQARNLLWTREGKLGYLWHLLLQVILTPQKGIESLSFPPSCLPPAPASSLPPSLSLHPSFFSSL